MKICIITYQYPTMQKGGVGTFTKRLSKQLIERGHEVHVVCPGDRSLNTLAQNPIIPHKEDGVTLHRTFPHLGTYHVSLNFEFRAIGEYIKSLHKKNRFDILHGVFLTPPGFIAAIVGREERLPLVVSARGSDIEILRYNPYHFQALSKVVQLADIVTGQTDAQIKKMVTFAKDEKKFRKTPLGFDPSMYDGRCLNDILSRTPWRLQIPARIILKQKMVKKSFMIGTAGYFRYQKGLDLLIKAFKKVKEKVPEAFLCLLGSYYDANEWKAHQNLIKSLAIKKDVLLTGDIPPGHILSWLGELDLFVMGSRYESTSNTLMEALYAEVPVVSAKFDGAEEMITDGQNGLLAEVESDDSLAEKIIQMYKNKEASRIIAQNAKRIIANEHSPEKEWLCWENVYRETIAIHKQKYP